MADIVTSAGKGFSALEGESILAAALRNGVSLQYSCQTGRCGTCKARLREGATVALHDEAGLEPAALGNGWILTCVRVATSRIVLEVEDLGDVKIAPTRTLPCRIDALERLSSDVLKVMLRLPPNVDFEYHPGQYIDVVGHGGIRRSYSIANAPEQAGRLELHIREVPTGAMSHYWFDRARVNDLLRLRGPLGTFFLRGIADRHLIFLATGTGIAPIKAMLEGLNNGSRESWPRSITVCWGGRVSGDLYWSCDSIGLNHRFVPVLSRAGDEWQGMRGHVQDALLALQPDMHESIVYACGSENMIRDARRTLIDAGLPERNYLSDAFVLSGASQMTGDITI